MSADEEPREAAADAVMSESHSNKRKASVDQGLENGIPASPKRAKLEAQEAQHATAEGRTSQSPVTKDDDTDQKDKASAQPKDEARAPSPPPPRRASPHPSRSPTLSRRPSIPTPEPKQAPDRGRKNVTEQEKKRGKRLFGGLLSTLSGKPANSQPKKRADFERRQQERAQQQRAEDEKRRAESDKRMAERLKKLSHVRRVAQVDLDEKVMQTRHSNMLARAQCLSTSCEPKLFYLPWKLTEAQETTRKEQVLHTKEIVEKEAAEFRRSKKERLRDLGVAVAEADTPENANTEHHPPPTTASKPVPEEASHKPEGPDKVKDEEESRANATLEKGGHDKENDHDDAGYVMVEGEEDTVIY